MSTTTNKRFISILVGAVVGLAVAVLVVVWLNREKPAFDYTVYPVEQGWGYDITCRGETVVHQPFVPALPGTTGFSEKRDAAEVARLVIRKLENGEPPTVTGDEVRQAIGNK